MAQTENQRRAVKKFKDRHPDMKNRHRLQNYYARNFGDGSKRRWTQNEKFMLDRSDITDTEIARMLKRSVLAIQSMRCKCRTSDTPRKGTPKAGYGDGD